MDRPFVLCCNVISTFQRNKDDSFLCLVLLSLQNAQYTRTLWVGLIHSLLAKEAQVTIDSKGFSFTFWSAQPCARLGSNKGLIMLASSDF